MEHRLGWCLKVLGQRQVQTAHTSLRRKKKEVGRALCKWIHLCSYISLSICWWEQTAVTIPHECGFSLCDLSWVLKSLYDIDSYYTVGWTPSCIRWFFLWPQLLLLLFNFFLMNLRITALTSHRFKCMVPCLNSLRWYFENTLLWSEQYPPQRMKVSVLEWCKPSLWR